jgi:hypothetical protein
MNDDQRRELSKKNADANKRSRDNARGKGSS